MENKLLKGKAKQVRFLLPSLYKYMLFVFISIKSMVTSVQNSLEGKF